MRDIRNRINRELQTNNSLLFAPLIVSIFGTIHLLFLTTVVPDNLIWPYFAAGGCYLIMILISLTIFFTRRSIYKQILQDIKDLNDRG